MVLCFFKQALLYLEKFLILCVYVICQIILLGKFFHVSMIWVYQSFPKFILFLGFVIYVLPSHCTKSKIFLFASMSKGEYVKFAVMLIYCRWISGKSLVLLVLLWQLSVVHNQYDVSFPLLLLFLLLQLLKEFISSRL